jgi:hypothetical protein
MFRSLLLGGLLVLVPPGVARSAPAPEAKPGKSDQLLANLRKPVTFNGFEADVTFTLRQALDHLAEQYGLSFDVNEEAFQAEEVAEVLAKPVAERPLPRQERTTPAAVLKRVLSRLPTQSGADWLLRGDAIEITTQAALRAEVWGRDYQGPFLPLTHARFDRQPLNETLKELAEQTGFNVVLDPRTGDKAKTLITARLNNLPLDTAVATLADMAGLKTTRTDNVLYVSTEERLFKPRPEPPSDLSPLSSRGVGSFSPLSGTALPPVKQATFDKKPLHEALKDLVEGTGYNLVIDTTRLGDKARTPVTTALKDVPVDTAVRLVADLAGLRVVIIDNVAYLTTPENAKEMQAEQDQRLLRLNPSGGLMPRP